MWCPELDSKTEKGPWWKTGDARVRPAVPLPVLAPCFLPRGQHSNERCHQRGGRLEARGSSLLQGFVNPKFS